MTVLAILGSVILFMVLWTLVGALCVGVYNAIVASPYNSWGTVDDGEARTSAIIFWPIWLFGIAVVLFFQFLSGFAQGITATATGVLTHRRRKNCCNK